MSKNQSINQDERMAYDISLKHMLSSYVQGVINVDRYVKLCTACDMYEMFVKLCTGCDMSDMNVK